MAPLRDSHGLLGTLTELQLAFLQGQNASRLFDKLLSVLLELTGSEYGFIAERVCPTEGPVLLRTHALSHIDWTDEERESYAREVSRRLEFNHLRPLLGAALVTGAPMISNAPHTDGYQGGLPPGHPPLRAFLGLPFHAGPWQIGMVGLSNRAGGYDAEGVAVLQPVLATCGVILKGLHATERMGALANIVNVVTSEINNPLSAVSSSLHFATEEVAALAASGETLASERGRELREALSDARAGGDRMQHLVHYLRSLSRDDDKCVTTVDVREELDRSLMVAWSQTHHRARLARYGEVPRVERDYGEVPRVEVADSRLVGKIFLPLLTNAAQAIPPDEPGHHAIHITTRYQDGQVVVVIRDTGEGISPENVGRLFDPSVTHPVRTIQGKGLFICHKIVSEMGGLITVESTVGQGTTFRVSLPIKFPSRVP